MSTKERRSLVEGLNQDPELKQLEDAFVFGAKRKSESIGDPVSPKAAQPVEPSITSAVRQNQHQPEQRILPQMMSGRIPVTTRCRPEVASALKRASLQRQLDGLEPHFVQDIMEEAVENWLRDHRYISDQGPHRTPRRHAASSKLGSDLTATLQGQQIHQYENGNANHDCRVCNVERGPVITKGVKIQVVRNRAVAQAINRVTNSPADDQREGNRCKLVIGPP